MQKNAFEKRWALVLCFLLKSEKQQEVADFDYDTAYSNESALIIIDWCSVQKANARDW